jgi:hypothetical protein
MLVVEKDMEVEIIMLNEIYPDWEWQIAHALSHIENVVFKNK